MPLFPYFHAEVRALESRASVRTVYPTSMSPLNCTDSSPSVVNYQSTSDPNIRIRIPKKVLTPVKVEAKVWFANERTFISYLSMGLLLSTIASGLLFGARDSSARYFALAYAVM